MNSYSYDILLVVFGALAGDANNCVYIVVLVCNRHFAYFVGDNRPVATSEHHCLTPMRLPVAASDILASHQLPYYYILILQ